MRHDNNHESHDEPDDDDERRPQADPRVRWVDYGNLEDTDG
ncbi:hypothetical protein ACFQL9_13020 [Halobaculum lipolyticum]|uniref:Uncharacterized protein n=1 Tax=Halobaculum lipolyticum TaxID=3032001 RepID=A0ABD5WJ96_9EURY